MRACAALALFVVNTTKAVEILKLAGRTAERSMRAAAIEISINQRNSSHSLLSSKEIMTNGMLPLNIPRMLVFHFFIGNEAEMACGKYITKSSRREGARRKKEMSVVDYIIIFFERQAVTIVKRWRRIDVWRNDDEVVTGEAAMARRRR